MSSRFRNIEYVLFDAANTLIHKPALWPSMLSVFKKYGYDVPLEKLQYHHKLLSEVVNFPDRTSSEFYRDFNGELLLSLGIIPGGEMLTELFEACSYLPWHKFDDTKWLNDCQLPLGVLSNFNDNLPGILQNLFGAIFSNIIVSESVQVRKPDPSFFLYSLKVTGISANKILYVGDSLKLDIVPAEKAGFNVCLIDRQDIFSRFTNRVSSLNEIDLVIK